MSFFSNYYPNLISRGASRANQHLSIYPKLGRTTVGAILVKIYFFWNNPTCIVIFGTDCRKRMF